MRLALAAALARKKRGPVGLFCGARARPAHGRIDGASEIVSVL
jgi:hypothetical protein